MMRRLRGGMQQGQSLTEMALLVPVLAGFFALTLQGGLVISDQVNLQHYAYEGAQWAVANRTTATAGAGGTIAQHIQAQMCGTSAGSPNPINTSSAVSRYCRDNTLSISVSTANTTAARGPGFQLGPWPVDAEAAACQQWDLGASPSSSQSSPISVAQGSSVDITASMTGVTGSGSSPVATLSLAGVPTMPTYLSNGTPQFNPPTIGSGGSSKINIAPSINTTLGTYHLQVDGIDQCGGTPVSGGHDVWVNVTDGGGPGTLSLPLNLHLDGVFPLCIPVGSPSSLTLHGVSFSAGASVVIGAGSSALTGTVTSNTSTQLGVTIPSPPTAGIFDATVTNGDGTSYTLANAVTVAASCPSPSAGTTSSANTACAAGAAGVATEYTVTITWTEKLIIPWISSNLGMTASQRAFCQ